MRLYSLVKKVLEYLGRKLIISEAMSFAPSAHILRRTVRRVSKQTETRKF